MKLKYKCNLKTILKNRDITEIELSKKTGIPVSRISEYCNNKRIPTILNAKKISIALNSLYIDIIWNFKEV